MKERTHRITTTHAALDERLIKEIKGKSHALLVETHPSTNPTRYIDIYTMIRHIYYGRTVVEY